MVQTCKPLTLTMPHMKTKAERKLISAIYRLHWAVNIAPTTQPIFDHIRLFTMVIPRENFYLRKNIGFPHRWTQCKLVREKVYDEQFSPITVIRRMTERIKKIS